MCGARTPTKPFACLALAPGNSVLDTAERFLNCFAPLPVSPGTFVPGGVALPVVSCVAELDDIYAGGPLDAPFFAQGVGAALGSFCRKSGCKKFIANKALKNLPDVIKAWLPGWFNHIWVIYDIPLFWKTA